MTLTEQISALVKSYRAADPVSLKTLSYRAFDDSRSLPLFMLGKVSLTLSRADRAIQWFSDHWPERAVWPAGVHRPARSPLTSGGVSAPVSTGEPV